MARYTLSGTKSDPFALSAEFEKVEASQKSLLSREGESPNQMEASLDMNNNRVLNLPAPASPTDPVRLKDLTADDVLSVSSINMTTYEILALDTALATGTIIETSGFSNEGDGGGSKWKKNGVEGQTLSQTPIQLGAALLNDALGGQWELVKSDLMDVRVLGVFPDTSDNSIGMNIACQSFPCYIPAGTFRCAGLTPSYSISGIGTLKKPDGSSETNIIFINGESNIHVKGITLDGNKGFSTGFTNLQVENSSYINIEGVTSTKASGHGISITNSSDSSVKDCTSSLNDYEGIEVRSSTECVIDNNRVRDNIGHGISFTKDVDVNQFVTVSRNKVNDNSRTGINIPFETNSLDPRSVDINVTGNIANNNLENGFLMQMTRGNITDNISRSNGTTNINQGFVVNGADLNVGNNISEYNAGVGIDFGNTYKATCTGNTIVGNGIIGLEINSSEDITATGNLISGNYSTNPAFSYQAAVVVEGLGTQWPTIKSQNINISGNVIKSGTHQTHGISISNSLQVHVSNNNLYLSGSTADIRVDNMFEYDFELVNNKTTAQGTASASTLTIDSDVNFFSVNTNGGQINTIERDGLTVLQKGDTLTIRFLIAGIVVGNGTGNIDLGGSNYTSTQNSTLSLIHLDGTWFKTSST